MKGYFSSSSFNYVYVVSWDTNIGSYNIWAYALLTLATYQHYYSVVMNLIL